MKTINILKSLALFAALLSFAACDPQLGNEDDPQGGVPEFPELVENYAVEPGSTQELTFTPNLDWKLSIPSEIRQWFWIQDRSFKLTELSGAASSDPITICIGVTETADFDMNYSCDVTLAMGDSTKVIAKYMLPAKEKTLQIYAAKTLSEGEFELAEDGVSYVYSTEAADKFNLIWSTTDADFRLPIKVVSNCEWTVQLPEWAEVNVPETTVGVVELVITGEVLEGASGKVTFRYGENTLAEFDVTVPSCGEFEVYSSKLTDGEYEFGEDGDYAWSESPVDEVSLAWLGSDFRVPVKVSTKCNWTVLMPEWLTVELPEKTAGDVTLILLGVPSKYPLTDTSSKIFFKNGDTVIGELKVNIPGCNDIMTFSLDMSLTSIEYNSAGNYKTSTGYVEGSLMGHLTGSQNVRMFAVETTGNKIGAENPEWLKVEVAKWNTANDAAVLQERDVTISATANKGVQRSAYIFVLPPSMPSKVADLLNEDGAVKEEYASYAIPVTQASDHYDSYISMNMVQNPQYAYSFEVADSDKAAELSTAFGQTDHVYVLNYSSPYCNDDAYMTMAIDFESYKVFASKDSSIDMSADEDFWLQYKNGGDSNNYGVVNMYLNMDIPVKQSVGYVVFYGSGNSVLAIVECQSPSVPEVLEIDVKSLIFASEASDAKINVTSNVDWTVTSDADWCTVSSAEGSKNGEVIVTVVENDVNQDRTAKIIIKSENISYVVTVEQKFGAVLEADVEELSFDCLGATETIHVISNVDWTIESSQSWCTVAKSDDSNIIVSAPKYDGTTVRTAVITLKSEKVTKSINVTQMYDDGSVTNGDETVHFVDWADARSKGAVLQRLTSGELYEEHRTQIDETHEVPIYHLTYTRENDPVRIVIPSDVQTYNANPYQYRENFRVNDTIYDQYRGPSFIMSEVVMDSDNSVAINMYLPDGKDFLRGRLNFIYKGGSAGIPNVILICTIDVSAE